MFPRRHLPDEFEAAHSKALAEYVWSVIEENPILSDPSSPIPVKLASGSREIKVHEKTRLLTQASVRPTQCGDLVEFIEQYRDSFTTDESLDLVQDPVVADAESAFFLTAIDQLSTGYQQNHALLTIDLRASNDQLDADFRAWLNLARKTYRAPGRGDQRRNITKTMKSKWTSYQLLAYLDILLWLRLNDKSVGQFPWGMLLFPKTGELPFNDETLPDLAAQALSIETVNTLQFDSLNSRK